nr:retrovirus-related Pol polyprotein from transposon TNT 1-94 [Tanacetum cinerariifolium]
MNVSPENKAHFEAKKEAIHLILIRIGDKIYSTVDACQTTQEMWEAIERLEQEWSRFVMIVKQQHKLDEVSYHKLFDILKQYKKEVNELRAERLAMNANLLALLATAQANQVPYYQTSRSHKSYASSSKPSIPTRSNITTRHKGKEIAKPITPLSETASEEDNDPKQAQRDKDMTVNVDGAREIVGSPVVQQSGIKCFNYKEFGHFAKECRKPKRVKDSTYHKEKMLLCKQAEQVETDDSNVIPDSPDMCEDDIQNDQNDVESNDERVELANLIANLKLNVDENKRIQKQLKKANTTFAQELKECKAILTETNQFCTPTAQDIEILIQTCLMPLAIKTQNDSFRFVHELKQEMHADYKYIESLKKEIDELESDKAEFSNMYDVILQEYLEAQLQDKNISISELKKLIEKGKGKYVDTKFDKPFVVRQPNAQRIPKPSVLGKPAPFLNSLERIYFSKTKLVPKANVSEGLSKPVTAQTLPQTGRQAISNTNVLKPGMYRMDNRLSHLNFDYINLLSKKDIVIGLPKLKYVKDQLCSSYELSKSKRSSFKSKAVLSSKGTLNLLHMDLCGPMRVASINGMKYIMVIIDDYSRYTWTLFLHSKDETPEVLKEFLMMIQRNLQALVITVRTDRGTKFLNKTLSVFFKEEGIEHQTSTARTPEQETLNQTPSQLPLFF